MSKIEWTERTLNPIVGCSIVSPGCTNCYAMKMAGRLEAMDVPHYQGLTKPSKAGSVWTGKMGLAPEHILIEPLKRRKPTMYFVNSMSDLFHESIPDEWIDQVFAVMALCPQHTFQVLTKRSGRMRKYLNDANVKVRISADSFCIADKETKFVGWPLPNVWLGISAERQQEADVRIPDLLATPAAVRFVSAEPLLSAIDFKRITIGESAAQMAGHPEIERAQFVINALAGVESFGWPGLDWVIVGGESGPGARPMHPDWARSIRDQCTAAGVAFFFKQWGEWAPTSGIDVYCHGPERKQREFPNSGGICWLRDGRICLRDFSVADHADRIRRGVAHTSRAIEIDDGALADFHAVMNDPSKYPGDQNPLGLQWMYRVGKKKAGRMLDGRTWDETPTREVAA